MSKTKDLLNALGNTHGQVGIVVPDLWASLEAHIDLGPWTVYTYDDTFIPDLEMYGERRSFAFRLAFNSQTPQLEFIQPLDAHSPYGEWLTERGPSVHHLGFYVNDASAAAALSVGMGYPVIMSGSQFGADGSGAYYYVDTQSELGYLVEIIQRPKLRHEPEAVVRTIADLKRLSMKEKEK